MDEMQEPKYIDEIRSEIRYTEWNPDLTQDERDERLAQLHKWLEARVAANREKYQRRKAFEWSRGIRRQPRAEYDRIRGEMKVLRPQLHKAQRAVERAKQRVAKAEDKKQRVAQVVAGLTTKSEFWSEQRLLAQSELNAAKKALVEARELHHRLDTQMKKLDHQRKPW
jgi:chromosome segregation ATPase